MKKKIISLLLAITLTCPIILQAQNNNYTIYIAKYHHLAQHHMRKYKIPASITLAQALLESGAGKSFLATKANNHFGIKAHGNWQGPTVLRDDDRPNERFRKYKHVEDSYEDHSHFLLRPRYAELFKYHITDYRSWAKGLKRAGYATNPHYANSLINIIETYELHKYDKKYGKHKYLCDNLADVQLPKMGNCNGCVYMIARKGDTYASIAQHFNLWEKQLRKYNEAPKNVELSEGDIVYLDKKKKHVGDAYKGTYHTVKAGESLHRIAQLYGVRIKTLVKANRLPKNYCPQVGDKIKLL